MRGPIVIDTNVLLVANGQTPQASLACQEASHAALEAARNRGTVLVDSDREIFSEYIAYLNFSGQPGLGDMFFKWLWDNQGHEELCQQVNIHRVEDERVYAEFPADPRLSGFDRSDRKFAAVALASQGNPPILNASDSDWWEFKQVLEENGLMIRNLCPELIES